MWCGMCGLVVFLAVGVLRLVFPSVHLRRTLHSHFATSGKHFSTHTASLTVSTPSNPRLPLLLVSAHSKPIYSPSHTTSAQSSPCSGPRSSPNSSTNVRRSPCWRISGRCRSWLRFIVCRIIRINGCTMWVSFSSSFFGGWCCVLI